MVPRKSVNKIYAPLPFMWKDDFGRYLRTFLEQTHRLHAATDAEAYRGLVAIQNKHGMWGRIGDICGASQKNAHDFFHNTWSKRFCDSFEAHKAQMTEQLRRLVQEGVDKSEALTAVIGGLQQEHPGQNFHLISLRQLLTHSYDRMAARQQAPRQPRVQKERRQEVQRRQKQVLPRQWNMDTDDLIAELAKLL
ncbi:Conserved_hypothetical protein [Hexamita inflata]|uniref:Uncharacterized protein n=1 Tax=Hexamita inflata TaxID=28002 RepID=A0AA86NI99_9EUKA|nr:Conserved hypothetical protein [Hexamita inflata]